MGCDGAWPVASLIDSNQFNRRGLEFAAAHSAILREPGWASWHVLTQENFTATLTSLCWRFPLQTQQKTWHLLDLSGSVVYGQIPCEVRFLVDGSKNCPMPQQRRPTAAVITESRGPQRKIRFLSRPMRGLYERCSNSEVESRVLRSAMAHAGHTATRWITDLFFSWIWRCHLHHLHPPGKFGESVQDAEPGDSIFLYFSGATPREQGLTGTDRD